jgi:hypothetical protein
MFSWQQATDSWNFCLLPSPSGVYMQAEQVFSEKCRVNGATGAKRVIAKLPMGSTVYWSNQLQPEDMNSRGKRLTYPPEKVIEEIEQFAERHGIHVQTPNQLLK